LPALYVRLLISEFEVIVKYHQKNHVGALSNQKKGVNAGTTAKSSVSVMEPEELKFQRWIVTAPHVPASAVTSFLAENQVACRFLILEVGNEGARPLSVGIIALAHKGTCCSNPDSRRPCRPRPCAVRREKEMTNV
jgi:hypothetical protein